jgi:hypothetical protein
VLTPGDVGVRHNFIYRIALVDGQLEVQVSTNGSSDWPPFCLRAFKFGLRAPVRMRMSDANGVSMERHIAVSVFTRGLLRRLVTRIYFPGEPGNAEDFALKLIEEGRRHTLIAKKLRDNWMEWNVVLQGADETVFFDC